MCKLGNGYPMAVVVQLLHKCGATGSLVDIFSSPNAVINNILCDKFEYLKRCGQICPN